MQTIILFDSLNIIWLTLFLKPPLNNTHLCEKFDLIREIENAVKEK